MAISKVRIKINGSWISVAKNQDGKWVGNFTAPVSTSYNLAGKYYPIEVEITNDAGTVVTYDSSSDRIGSLLRLVVKEKTKPIITLVSPTNGTQSQNNKQPITFKVTDEVGGSGIDLSTVSLRIDSDTYTQSSPGISKTNITNGYQFVYTPQTALADGSHTITINVKDHDGNAATAVTSTFKVDTVPPTLSILSPTDGLVTNSKSITLKGTTNDATSSPVTVTATLNGTSVGAITVADGSFTKAITGTEGDNVLIVKAQDATGRTTTVTVNFTIDTGVPQISSVTLSPNPVDTGKSVQIVLEIS